MKRHNRIYFIHSKINLIIPVLFLLSSKKILCKNDENQKELLTKNLPSYSCSGQLNETEKTICNSENLSKFDQNLNTLYLSLKVAIQFKNFDLSKNEHPRLKDQRSWLKQRNSCESDLNCIQTSYLKRIHQLIIALNELEPQKFTFNTNDLFLIENRLQGKILTSFQVENFAKSKIIAYISSENNKKRGLYPWGDIDDENQIEINVIKIKTHGE